MKGNHKCITDTLKAECPVCLEDMMYSVDPSIVLSRCGHGIHAKCFKVLSKFDYKCPICFKSVEDMSHINEVLEAGVKAFSMPPEYANKEVDILCNECSKYLLFSIVAKER